jgi:formiminotetrahydrofolate cyclodeaminase
MTTAAPLDFSSFLEDLASPTPTPAGGSAAAVAAALGASLAELAARVSGDEAAATEAASLRERLLALAAEDVQAVEELLAGRPERAIEIPSAIAREASRTAELATRLAEAGKASIHGDAIVAALLAGAAARSAETLVELNLHES